MHRVGIVGHCTLDTDAAAFVRTESGTLLAEAVASTGDVVAISALAEGADTLFAEAAVARDVPLEVVRPYAGYEQEFSSELGRRRYLALAAAARTETRLRFGARSTHAYEASMRWVVQNCDVLVAAWDGRPSHARGGTAHTIRVAAALGRPVVHLDVTRCVVT